MKRSTGKKAAPAKPTASKPPLKAAPKKAAPSQKPAAPAKAKAAPAKKKPASAAPARTKEPVAAKPAATKSKPPQPKPPQTKAKAPAKKAAPAVTTPKPRATVRKVATVKARVAATPKAAPAPSPAAATATVKRRLPKIPALLLEGDHSPADLPTGPGSRYSLGLAVTSTTPDLDDLALPESYGTRKLWTVARDPQWLYVRWDLNREQLLEYNQLSRDGHLLLRIFDAAAATEALTEIHVHPESASWFAHVGRGGGRYFAVLGFRDKVGEWHEVSRSSVVTTPPDSLSEELEAEFANLPSGITFTELIRVIREYVAGEPALTAAIEDLRASGRTDLPELPPPAEFLRWSIEQQQALADLISMDEVRQVWAGSQEITELIQGRRDRDLASIAAIPAGAAGAERAISSPHGGGQAAKRSFWLNVNAELIVYGATEPDAAVTIGGRKIRLRPDGSFSYRFALPDGEYSLPVAATSADQEETRAADLSFTRQTDYTGDVQAHPQDKALRHPDASNLD